jgi:two-component system sensor histidine kinase ArlS
MNKISLKIGLLFFVAVLLLEGISMFMLHNNIIHSRVHDELSALLTRGNNHREVLENSMQDETIKHIAIMEARTDTQVILTTADEKIEMSSNSVSAEMKKIIRSTPKKVSQDGAILAEDWQNGTYIASVSPIMMNHKLDGYVYMFQSTEKLKELISGLNRHFFLAGLLSFIFTGIIIIFLTRYVTHPLIQMNAATKRLSKGDFSVSLPSLGKDELGELAGSIKVLANDLELLKTERNDFLASISHELRTPLTYIKGYADIARRPDTNEEDRAKYLSIIHEESGKLASLVKELFDLAKMDENSFTIEKTEISLLPFFENIYEKMAPALRDAQMKLVLRCPQDLTAFVDPVRFEQVLFNLLDNARKYSGLNTDILLEAYPNDGKVHIIVADKGKGIPEEDLPRIFERFYRVDKSRTRALGGSGLGLSIVKQLVEAHGGTIRVTSMQNVGTTFEIII